MQSFASIGASHARENPQGRMTLAVPNTGTNNRANNRMSNAFSMRSQSSSMFGRAYLQQNEASEDLNASTEFVNENCDDFMSGVMEINDAVSETRSATNLKPYKKDFGNRFSRAGVDRSGESFLKANPLA